MTMGERIQRLLTQRGQNQRQLAGLVGLTPAAISRFIAGGITPSAKSLTRIADALDTTTDYLLGRTDTPERANYAQSVEAV